MTLLPSPYTSTAEALIPMEGLALHDPGVDGRTYLLALHRPPHPLQLFPGRRLFLREVQQVLDLHWHLWLLCLQPGPSLAPVQVSDLAFLTREDTTMLPPRVDLAQLQHLVQRALPA